MTSTISTTESSTNVKKLFQANAVKAFDECLGLVNELSLYEHTLKMLDGNVDLQTDLPALKKVSKKQAQQTLTSLIEKSSKAIESVWSLDSKYSKFFRTTVRINNRQDSALPCFDIEHTTKNQYGNVKISIATWRRNLQVNIIGRDNAIEVLHGQLVMASFKN
jgi:hypothetical protein